MVEPINLLKKLPSTFYTELYSEKWQERKNALDKLLQLLTDSPKIDLNENYSELINSLKKLLEKDLNINVTIVAAKCVTQFAKNLKKNFSVYSREFVPIILERFKEKKPSLRDALIECIDAVYATTNLGNISDSVINAANKSNPNIKIQLDSFLYRVCKNLKTDDVLKKFIKELIPILIKHANESDPGVREAACSALGAIMKFFGQNAVLILFGSFANDKLKMAKVEEFYLKAVEESKLEVLDKNLDNQENFNKSNTGETDETANVTLKEEIDVWELLNPVDIFPKIPSTFKENLQSKKWLERKTVLETLHQIFLENPRLLPSPNYNELVAELTKVLNDDININVASFAAKCLTDIAKGLRKDFSNYSRIVIPVVFAKFKDKKAILKDALVECSDAVFLTTNLETIIEDVLVAGQKSYLDVKIQLDLFLFRVFKQLKASEISKKSLKEITMILIKHASDSDVNVRDASYAALAAIIKCVGKKTALSLFGDLASDKTKIAKINQNYNQIIEDCGLSKTNVNLFDESKTVTKNTKNTKTLFDKKTTEKNLQFLKEKKIKKFEANQSLNKENNENFSQTKNKADFKPVKLKKKPTNSVAKIECTNKTHFIENKKNPVSKLRSVKLTVLENNKFYANTAKSDYNIKTKNNKELNFNLLQPRYKSHQDFFKPLQEKIFITGQKSRIPRLSAYQLSTTTK